MSSYNNISGNVDESKLDSVPAFPDKAVEEIEGWQCISEAVAMEDHSDWFDLRIVDGILATIDETTRDCPLGTKKLTRIEYGWVHLRYDAHIEYESVWQKGQLWSLINFRLSNDGLCYDRNLKEQTDRHGNAREEGRPPSKTWCRLAHKACKLARAIAFAKKLNGDRADFVDLWCNYEDQRLDLEVVNQQGWCKVQFSFHPGLGPKAECDDVWGDNEPFEM